MANLETKVTTANAEAEDSAVRRLLAEYNDLAAMMNALLAKLDADAGVASDYVSTIGTADILQRRGVTL